jgi:hypothetical protein
LAKQAGEPGLALRQLERYLKILDERAKEWFYLPMLVLMGGSHCAVAIESWRRCHGAEFARWIDAWAEFEALNALGCYAFECPGDVLPSIEPDAVAGVVNYSMQRNFNGTELSLRYGITQEGDGEEYRATLTHGLTFAQGKGRAMITADYYNRDAVLARDRAFSAEADNSYRAPAPWNTPNGATPTSALL